MSPEDPTASDGSATTGGVADEPGCGCRSPSAPPPGFLGGLFLGLLGLRARRPRRRTRRAPSAALGGLLLAALAAGPAACNGGPTTTELPMTTTTSGETDADTDTEQLPSEPDPQLFGTFYDSYVHPGWSNEDLPESSIDLSGYQVLTLLPDSSTRLEVYMCQFPVMGDFLLFDESLTWDFIPETGELVINPSAQEDPSIWAQRIESMVIGLNPECDDGLLVTTKMTTGVTFTIPYRPGRLCAEFSYFEKCRYSLQWCGEGEPGPLCPEAQPL